MKLTEKKAITMLERARLWEVEEAIDMYPENERDGRDDFQMLADEAGYILSLYDEDTCHADDLKQSKEILRATNYGKSIDPVWVSTLKPVYKKSDIECAKDSVNEYNRLKRFVERLEKIGYYSKWL